MIGSGTLQWRGQIDPIVCGLLVLAVAAGLWWGHRLLAARTARVWRVFWPKLAVMLLLVLVLFEPVWNVERKTAVKGRLLALVDVSSSMDVADDGAASRVARARKAAAELAKALPEGLELDVREFDTGVRKAGEPPPEGGARGTDLGGCLAVLEQKGETAAAIGMVLLTDGGDEPLDEVRAPPIPLHAVAIGTAPETWNDIAITDIAAPVTAEKDAGFAVEVGLSARAANAAFAATLPAVEVRIEREGAEQPEIVAAQKVDLSRKRARARFRISAGEPGLGRYRASVAVSPGEVSAMNNARPFAIDVQKRSLHVLFYTRELGVEFKALRAELARDPGIAFTALFRTVSERFTIQGDRSPGDGVLEAGFPTNAEALASFDCVIIGSFEAAEWRVDQMKALAAYVDNGGAAVFLGGEKSFAAGGYGTTELAPLFPWRIEEGDGALIAGNFPTAIAAAGAGHPVLAGLDAAYASGPALASVNLPGPLRPGAVALIEAQARDRAVAVVAAQSYGRGRVMGVATNTHWQWTRGAEALRDAYGVFWRQAVRFLCGKSEGGRVLRVQWDKARYRPGEAAVARVRLAADQDAELVRLSPALTVGGESRPASVEPVAGDRRAWTVHMRFGERGQYAFRLSAYSGEQILENYEKEIPVEALVPEGSRLEVNTEDLRRLAERSGGSYMSEPEAAQLGKVFAERVGERRETVERPLAQAGPYFAGLVMLLACVEWWLRRRANLV